MKSIFFLTIGIFCTALSVFALSNTSSQVVEQSEILSCRKCGSPQCAGGGYLASCCDCCCPCQTSGCNDCQCCPGQQCQNNQVMNLAGCRCGDKDCDYMACKGCGKKKKKLPKVSLATYQLENPIEGTLFA